MSTPSESGQDRPFDYPRARQLIVEVFAEAEADFQSGAVPPTLPSLIPHFDQMFASSTQSLREGLLGCVIARNIDKILNIRLPYVSQGKDAFNGRKIDEEIVNPLLQARMVPCSKGPYLAKFRRGFKFEPDVKAVGSRDKKGFTSLLALIDQLERMTGEDELRGMLRYLLYRFVMLRDAANIPLSRIHRLSTDQYESLIGRLLQVPSGGLLPVLLTVATFEALRESFASDWVIDWQGINVADRASGAGGDITVRRATGVLAIEVTERRIDANRIVSTFNTKIAPNEIEDYIFIYTDVDPTQEARDVASKYFAQGHEIGFLRIKAWMAHVLGILGPKGRRNFSVELLKLLDTKTVPAALKVAWNDQIEALLGQ